MKAGDVVKCIDPDIYGHLHKGSVYTIRHISSSGFVYLVGFLPTIGFFKRRFELIDEPPEQKQACTCTSKQLLWGGCICGAIKRSN